MAVKQNMMMSGCCFVEFYLVIGYRVGFLRQSGDSVMAVKMLG